MIGAKRGQGISLETIITAAIVLIVLVVLFAIFTGRLQLFDDDLDENTKATECTDWKTIAEGCGEKIADYTTPYKNRNENLGKVCCVARSQ